MYELFVCKRLYVVGSNWPGARLSPWPHTGGNLGPGIENTGKITKDIPGPIW